MPTPESDIRNNCTESSYFLSCKMTTREGERRHRRCLRNFDVVDDCRHQRRRQQQRPYNDNRHNRIFALDAAYCKIYSLLVEHDGVVFKNPHCAACNGVRINQTSCLPVRPSLPQLPGLPELQPPQKSIIYSPHSIFSLFCLLSILF